jgi:hypothetical protein
MLMKIPGDGPEVSTVNLCLIEGLNLQRHVAGALCM